VKKAGINPISRLSEERYVIFIMEEYENNQANAEKVEESTEEIPVLAANTGVFEEIKEENGKKPSKSDKFFENVFELLETMAIAIVIMVVALTLVVKYVTVDGYSMNNTLDDGQMLIITPNGGVEQGDIIVLCHETHDDPLIKRVIATEGQTIVINYEKWEVTVDGKTVENPEKMNKSTGNMNIGELETDPDNPGFTKPYVVGKGCVFVMGDNRNGSYDSRYFGDVEERMILGKVIFSISPFGTVD